MPAEGLGGSPGGGWAPSTIVHPLCPCPCRPPRDGRWSVVRRLERPARPHVACPGLPAEDSLLAGRCSCLLGAAGSCLARLCLLP